MDQARGWSLTRGHTTVGMAAWGLVVLALAGSPGCGRSGRYSGPLYSVKGRVILADGKPLSGGSVRFIPTQGGLPASGKIGADGTFVLRTASRDGAAPGEYNVRIEPSSVLLAKAPGRAVPKLPFASKYREYDGNTGLTATIPSRETELEPFRLDAR